MVVCWSREFLLLPEGTASKLPKGEKKIFKSTRFRQGWDAGERVRVRERSRKGIRVSVCH